MHISSRTSSASSRRESVVSALDSGAPMHAAVWRAMLHHATAVEGSTVGTLWAFLMDLCRPLRHEIIPMASCVHGSGHGFLMRVMSNELTQANYSGCSMYSYDNADAISAATMSQAQADCDAAPIGHPAYAFFCSGGIYDQLYITMHRLASSDGSEPPLDRNKNIDQAWHNACGDLKMGAGFWCFTPPRGAPSLASRRAGASEGDELPSSMQESVHAWATLFGFFSHEVIRMEWNSTVDRRVCAHKVVARPEELATNLMRKCDSCTGETRKRILHGRGYPRCGCAASWAESSIYGCTTLKNSNSPSHSRAGSARPLATQPMQ